MEKIKLNFTITLPANMAILSLIIQDEQFNKAKLMKILSNQDGVKTIKGEVEVTIYDAYLDIIILSGVGDPNTVCTFKLTVNSNPVYSKDKEIKANSQTGRLFFSDTKVKLPL